MSESKRPVKNSNENKKRKRGKRKKEGVMQEAYECRRQGMVDTRGRGRQKFKRKDLRVV